MKISRLAWAIVCMAGRMLQRIYHTFNLTIHNRGKSGNKIADLLARAPSDILDLNPHWVSLLIGINDTKSTTSAGTPLDDFERDYTALLELLHGRASIVMMTPFFAQVPGGAEKIIETFRPV